MRHDPLSKAAADDPVRIDLLKERWQRRKSTSRLLKCMTCGTLEYSHRDRTDICDACLLDLWNARSVMAGEYDKAKSAGLTAVGITSTPHWLPYPGLVYEHGSMPKDAVFANGQDDVGRALQAIYVKAFESLQKILPGDPQSRTTARPFLVYERDQDDIHVRLPDAFIDAMHELWHLIRWQSGEAFRLGFEEGRNMLSAMNLGQKTFEQFSEDCAKKIVHTRRMMEKAEKGEHN